MAGKFPDFLNWSLTVYFMYTLAVILNFFATLSVSFTPAPYNYIAEIDFNGTQATVIGLLKIGNPSFKWTTDVTGLEKLRLGNWGASYWDSHGSGRPLHFAYPYDLSYNGDTVISSAWTWPFLFQFFALVATCLSLGQYLNRYYVELLAFTLTGLMLIPDYFLLKTVENNMQKLGQKLEIEIVTKGGPAFSVAVAAAFFLLGGGGLRLFFSSRKAAADQKKQDDEEKANTNATVVLYKSVRPSNYGTPNSRRASGDNGSTRPYYETPKSRQASGDNGSTRPYYETPKSWRASGDNGSTHTSGLYSL